MNQNEMEIRLPQEKRGEAKEVLDLVNQMNRADQKELLSFLRGVAFGRGLASGEGVAAMAEKKEQKEEKAG